MGFNQYKKGNSFFLKCNLSHQNCWLSNTEVLFKQFRWWLINNKKIKKNTWDAERRREKHLGWVKPSSLLKLLENQSPSPFFKLDHIFSLQNLGIHYSELNLVTSQTEVWIRWREVIKRMFLNYNYSAFLRELLRSF